MGSPPLRQHAAARRRASWELRQTVLHGVGTRAFMDLLDNGGGIGVMQYQNATAEVIGGSIDEVRLALVEVWGTLK